jgi:hypothetical protein
MWGGTDCATFFYRSAGKEAFDCSLLVTGIDCPQMIAATRFGISVRSSLVSAETNAFALYMGMSGLGDIRGYADTDPTNGKHSLNTCSPRSQAELHRTAVRAESRAGTLGRE